jgi:hypothetical protein
MTLCRDRLLTCRESARRPSRSPVDRRAHPPPLRPRRRRPQDPFAPAPVPGNTAAAIPPSLSFRPPCPHRSGSRPCLAAAASPSEPPVLSPTWPHGALLPPDSRDRRSAPGSAPRRRSAAGLRRKKAAWTPTLPAAHAPFSRPGGVGRLKPRDPGASLPKQAPTAPAEPTEPVQPALPSSSMPAERL